MSQGLSAFRRRPVQKGLPKQHDPHDWITQDLQERLSPDRTDRHRRVGKHHGHAGWREAAKPISGFISCRTLSGKSRVERHRLVNEALEGAFDRGLHALAIQAKALGDK